MSQLSDLGRFYSILERLAASQQQGLKLSSYAWTSPLPARGVYFFREPGEPRPGSPGSHRIVRVGTHPVSANSKSTLWQRLRTHLGTRAGTGNHRGSIFRLHVGAAMLARDKVSTDLGSGFNRATCPPCKPRCTGNGNCVRKEGIGIHWINDGTLG